MTRGTELDQAREPFWALGRLLGVPTAVIPRNRASSAGRAVSIWPFLSSIYALALVAPPLRKSLVIRDLVSRNRTRKTTAPHLLEKWQADRKRPPGGCVSQGQESTYVDDRPFPPRQAKR